jgi:hypothetical protein
MPRNDIPPFHDPFRLFTNAPPHWIVGKGKPYESPSQTLGQANQQREEAADKLRWHGRHQSDAAALSLSATLLSCKRSRPCLSGACPICERAQQRLMVLATVNALPSKDHLFWMPPQVISLVPEFGRSPAGELANFDIAEFTQKSLKALRAVGISRYILGLDASLNHNDGEPEEAYWQLQWWGVFGRPADPWREQLKALVNPSNLVTRPVKVITPDSVEAAAAYGLKNTFSRRVSVVKSNDHRPDRGPCRNTNARPLRGNAWVELMLFLDRIGLEQRLLGTGYRFPYDALRSRKTVVHGNGE